MFSQLEIKLGDQKVSVMVGLLKGLAIWAIKWNHLCIYNNWQKEKMPEIVKRLIKVTHFWCPLWEDGQCIWTMALTFWSGLVVSLIRVLLWKSMIFHALVWWYLIPLSIWGAQVYTQKGKTFSKLECMITKLNLRSDCLHSGMPSHFQQSTVLQHLMTIIKK
jgi:hypothetical protein